MFHDLSSTMKAILDDQDLATDFPELFGAEVSFARPDDTFSVDKDTIDLFLFDVRENLDLRSNEPRVRRLGDEFRLEKPPRRVDCTYLVTAWPEDGTDAELKEHQLLAQALTVLGRYPTIPERFRQGDIAAQEPPPPMIAPQIEGLSNPVEFWSALGSKIRAGFTVAATVAVPVFPMLDGPLVTNVHTPFDVGEPPARETTTQFGGRVLVKVTGGGGPAIAGARAQILGGVPGARRDALSDSDGVFVFSGVPLGVIDLQIEADGYVPKLEAVNVPGPIDEVIFEMEPL